MRAKGPPNAPEVGDRVRLRGRIATGIVQSINKLSWVQVKWETGAGGPTLVHLFELEKLI